MYKTDPIRISRMFTFSWCYMLMFFIPSYCVWWTWHTFPSTVGWSDKNGIQVAAWAVGTILAYIPLVFLGAGVSVIVEAVAANSSLSRGLSISSKSWQGHGFLFSSGGKTMCGHCWSLPLRMFFTLYGSLAIIGILPVVALIWIVRSAAILVMFLAVLATGRKVREWKIFFEKILIFDDGVPSISQVFKPRPAAYRSVPSPNRYESGFLRRLWRKTREVVVALKRRACPIINWD